MENKPDRISELLDEAAEEIENLRQVFRCTCGDVSSVNIIHSKDTPCFYYNVKESES